ncbi:hypothetical protein MXMO3_00002 [Maritalea myrionectae]|uniref:Uncharacterized protein n=1 Tax=Maritalea myrionectae TaxID=454601 RepID=A0A2R4M963_9HYPH|nr:hypothetical protein MXMO3_00002 [Maritalea myrionectae]
MHHLQQLPHQASSRTLAQRHPGAIVDRNVKAMQFGNDLSGLIPIWRDDADRFTIGQSLARGHGDGATFQRLIGHRQETDLICGGDQLFPDFAALIMPLRRIFGTGQRAMQHLRAAPPGMEQFLNIRRPRIKTA